MLIKLAERIGLNPKRTAMTHGGEYYSPCPVCGGDDRFRMWPERKQNKCVGRYWCRQCNAQGDTIQFYMDYYHATYKEALAALGIEELRPMTTYTRQTPRPVMTTQTIIRPSDKWIAQAEILVQGADKQILLHKDILMDLQQRGLPLDAIKMDKIGFLPEDVMVNGTNWGLEQKELWLPRGILIPCLALNGSVIRLKVRRTNWFPGDTQPKYVAITGSMTGLNIIGDKKKAIMIVVESELDAYALRHAVGDLAVIIAIGGCIKNPDAVTDNLAHKKNIFICHDDDEAGHNMLKKWQLLYPHAKALPTPIGKDIGEAIKKGLNLRSWFIAEISKNTQPKNLSSDICIVSKQWSYADQLLIDWFRQYVGKRTITQASYAIFENEIALGPNSPRAQTGELQEGLQLMRQLVENE